jgi:DNA-binding NarL/FixJ family response regulator
MQEEAEIRKLEISKMDKEAIRVLIADDHRTVRLGIQRLLASAPDIVVVGEAADGAQAMEMVEILVPDVLLLDVEMPIMSGLQVANKLNQMQLPVRILALSAYDDQQYILGMLANGARGYLIKDEVPAKLLASIRRVAAGEMIS